ncbi:MAG TPA: hypothetical protein VFN30_00195 [Chitinophagaceae bacterium]|nr:hypothetical protein [Chitinophagaceae bacterium]
MRNLCSYQNKVILYFFLTTSLIPSISNSQASLAFGKSRYEVGFEIGPSVFLGDLGGHRGKGTYFIKDWNFPVTKFMIGVFAAVYPSEWLGFRVAGNICQIKGNDEYINTNGVWELTRKVRDIEFRSNIREVYAAFELYPTVLSNLKFDYIPRLRPYGVLGIGYFHFNPQAPYPDPATGKTTWIDLKPLRLEGQGIIAGRKEYELNQIMIPMGIGIKYDATDRWVINMEVLHRKTFTDYIDDVSIRYADINQIKAYLTPEQEAQARYILGQGIPNLQFRSPYGPGRKRGNPKRNDAYFSITVKIAYKFGSLYNSIFQNNLNKVRCPSYRF